MAPEATKTTNAKSSTGSTADKKVRKSSRIAKRSDSRANTPSRSRSAPQKERIPVQDRKTPFKVIFI